MSRTTRVLVTAPEVDTNCPAQLVDLAHLINVHVQKALKYEDKADQHRTTAGKYLTDAKQICDSEGFEAFREKLLPDVGKSRANELMQIASGQKSVEEVRASTRRRVAKHRARKSASVTVTDRCDAMQTPAYDSVGSCDVHTGSSRGPLTSTPAVTLRKEESTVPVLESSDIVQAPTCPVLGEEAVKRIPPSAGKPSSTTRNRGSSTGKASAFTALFMELVRITKNRSPEDFATTGAPVDELLRVGKLLTEIGRMRHQHEPDQSRSGRLEQRELVDATAAPCPRGLRR